MTDNVHQYGFRWAYNANGKDMPEPELMDVASGVNFTIPGNATNLNLNVGDPVFLTAGFLNIAQGNESSGTSQAPWGVVVGMGPVGFFNGTRMVRQTFLQSGCAYGAANIDRISQVLVVPFSAGMWEIDVDDNTTATTRAAYQALVGQNCDHQNYPNSQGFLNAQLACNPMLNIASHAAATATLSMRIRGISKNFANQDLTGKFVKLIVSVNKGQGNYFTNVGDS